MRSITVLSLIAVVVAAQAGTVTRREFVKDGVTYIEETNIGKNGNVSRNVFPKPGQDEAKLEAEAKALASEPKPTPRPRGGKGPKRKGGLTKASAKRLRQSIAACKSFELQAPHPLFEDFTIEYRVHGIEQGKCKFTQTMPSKEIQICRLTEAQRKDIAKRGADALQKWMGDATVCPITKTE